MLVAACYSFVGDLRLETHLFTDAFANKQYLSCSQHLRILA